MHGRGQLQIVLLRCEGNIFLKERAAARLAAGPSALKCILLLQVSLMWRHTRTRRYCLFIVEKVLHIAYAWPAKRMQVPEGSTSSDWAMLPSRRNSLDLSNLLSDLPVVRWITS